MEQHFKTNKNIIMNFHQYSTIIFIIFCLLNISELTSSTESQITNICSTDVNSKSICKCTNHSSSTTNQPILAGIWTVRIDCNSKRLNSTNFEWSILPIYTDELDLSWNDFTDIPDFVSNTPHQTLRRLNLAHNKITSTDNRNFIKVSNLTDLDLSWNRLELLSINTFAELRYLERLDLSGNNLRKINLNMFSPLISLQVLDISWNPKLNESSDIRELDFFFAYGITPKLKILKMGHCNLNEIHLNHAVSLQELHISWNNFITLPHVGSNLKFIDMSGNPLDSFHLGVLPHLFQLEILLAEDMPRLTVIDEYSLFGYPNLKVLSFQNSRLLSTIDPHAFGENIVTNETNVILERLNLRGTAVKRFNSTLLNVFKHLKVLDLTGLPLLCDCHLQWIHGLTVETGGRCSDPVSLRGLKMTELLDSQFECNNRPRWVSELFDGLLILLLLVLCSAGIWLIVLGLRPSHKKLSSPKLGPTSPYARITIEPNRGESY